MHIAGGLYRELCEIPVWDADFGSGGRAAAAVSALSPGSVLYTYAHALRSRGIEALERLGIRVRVHAAAHPIAFSYFHPLSRPYIAPAPGEVVANQPFEVSGETVIRFGFVEGDAIVDGSRVVYDPQTQRLLPPFGDNGSRAGELALVLNEDEMCSMGGSDDLDSAARHIVETQQPAVIVAKRGPRGVAVYQNEGRLTVPAYRSDRVFKIGTGDVFTAVFAFHWGERRIPPAEAANHASRAVAAYCMTRELPPNDDLARRLRPVGSSSPGRVLLVGSVNTLGRRWTMEEARFRLTELGAIVAAPALDRVDEHLASIAAVIVLADGISAGELSLVADAHSSGLPIVVLAETAPPCELERLSGATVAFTDDFVSSLYFAIWAAIPDPDEGGATASAVEHG